MIKLEKGMFTTVPILSVEGKPPQVQTLYTRMCKYANEDGKCRPSINTLCQKSGMSKNTVIKATKFLEDMGLIKKTNRCKEGEYTSNMYDVYVTPIDQVGSAGDEQPSANGEQPPSAGDEQPSANGEQPPSAGDEQPGAGDGNKLKQGTKPSSLTKTNIFRESDFEDFWKKYPRKVAKPTALKKYKALIKNGTVTHEKIMEGLNNYNIYIRKSGIEMQFIKHPPTWLNNGCWDDELGTKVKTEIIPKDIPLEQRQIDPKADVKPGLQNVDKTLAHAMLQKARTSILK